MDPNSNTTNPSPFRVLQHRVAEIHWKWKVWKQLFRDSGEEGYRLMKRQAPSFFVLIQRVLLDDLILQLCKLADPPEGGPKSDRRTNLVLQRAIEDAKPRLGAGTTEAVEQLMGQLTEKTATLRKWRNRRIAHHDMKTAIQAEPLDPIWIADIERTIDLVTEIMKHLQDGNSVFAYDAMIANGDGESLLQSLRWAEQHVQEAVRRGEKP